MSEDKIRVEREENRGGREKRMDLTCENSVVGLTVPFIGEELQMAGVEGLLRCHGCDGHIHII